MRDRSCGRTTGNLDSGQFWPATESNVRIADDPTIATERHLVARALYGQLYEFKESCFARTLQGREAGRYIGGFVRWSS